MFLLLLIVHLELTMLFIDCFNKNSTFYKKLLDVMFLLLLIVHLELTMLFIDRFNKISTLYKNTFGCNVSIAFDCSFGTCNAFH